MRIPYGLISLLVAIGCLALVIGSYALSQRRVRGALEFALLMLASGVYAVGYALELSRTELPAIMAAVRFEYVGIALSPTFWLLFARRYAGAGRPSVPFLALALLPPLAVLALVWTNDAFHLYYARAWVRSDSPYALIAFDRGPGYFLMIAYLYACVLAGNFLLARHALGARGRGRARAALVALGSLIPWAANVAYLAGAIPYGFDPVPIAISSSGFLFSVALFRLGFLELVPAARSAAIEALRDGFLVADRHGLVVDANAEARRMLPGLDAERPIPAGAPGSAELSALIDRSGGRAEFSAPGEGGAARQLSARAFAVLTPRGEPGGTAIMISDVTEMAALMARLRELADTDELTGVLSRRRFAELGARELESAKRRSRPLGVAILDLDRFKEVNDERGHAEGDRVLSRTGAIFRGGVRSVDALGRYGGDEFGLVLPEAGEAEALLIAERMVEALRRAAAAGDGGPPAVTASVGVYAAVPSAADRLEDYLKRADEALYAAKAEGRDRAVLWRADRRAGDRPAAGATS